MLAPAALVFSAEKQAFWRLLQGRAVARNMLDVYLWLARSTELPSTVSFRQYFIR
jgi:hypothetical protein